MAAPLVDTHCHLIRYDDPAAVLAAAERARVVTIAVTETPAEFVRQRALLPDSRYLRLALGLHPLRAAGVRDREVHRFLALAPQADYIGEVGVDLSRDGKSTGRRQMAVFDRILESDAVRARVLTVHSRGAAREAVERLVQTGARGILHWYSGSISVAETALAGGLYFSFNPPMMRSRSGRRLLAEIPRDRVLTETDGPYAKAGSRVAQPIDVRGVIRWLARTWETTEAQAAEQVAANMARLFAGK